MGASGYEALYCPILKGYGEHYYLIILTSARLNGASDGSRYFIKSLHLVSSSDGIDIDIGANYIQV